MTNIISMNIEKLKMIQKRDGLTDVKFAQKLGMHPISWNRLKNGRSGKVGLDEKTIKKIVRAYPELGIDILNELMGNSNEAK